MSRSYLEAAHAMMSGVAAKMNYDSKDVEPKHLRTGINSAMVSDAAIVRLLIKKGIFTLEEFEAELTDEMNREVERYEEELLELTGKKIILS